jgi:hypothetical protein
MQQHQQSKINELLASLDTTLKTGLTSQKAQQRRSEKDFSNVVDPPVRLPAWICCLLPCLKSLPSRKAFAQIQPDDAQVKRNSKWMRYEASCLVVGDIIRLEAGDIVPADCRVVLVEGAGNTRSNSINVSSNEENIGSSILIVDHSKVTGEERKTWSQRSTSDPSADVENAGSASSLSSSALFQKLYWGGQVIQGSCIAVVTDIGPDTFVAKLIQQGKFPIKVGDGRLSDGGMELDEEEGIALIGTAGGTIS